MAMNGRPSINKRNREQARRARTQEKAERRARKAFEKSKRPTASGDEDPDIAGIVPGPQPRVENE
jgi:hypothetical protein